MKKLVTILICLGLALSGCAAKTFVFDGMTYIEQTICPTTEMAKEAFAAAGFLTAFPQLQGAFAVFDWLSKGLCVANSQLLQALKDFDSATPALKGVGQVKPKLDALRAAVK